MEGVDDPFVVELRQHAERRHIAPAVRADHDPVLLVHGANRCNQVACERGPQLVLPFRRHRLVQQLEDDVWLAPIAGCQRGPECQRLTTVNAGAPDRVRLLRHEPVPGQVVQIQHQRHPGSPRPRHGAVDPREAFLGEVLAVGVARDERRIDGHADVVHPPALDARDVRLGEEAGHLGAIELRLRQPMTNVRAKCQGRRVVYRRALAGCMCREEDEEQELKKPRAHDPPEGRTHVPQHTTGRYWQILPTACGEAWGRSVRCAPPRVPATSAYSGTWLWRGR